MTNDAKSSTRWRRAPRGDTPVPRNDVERADEFALGAARRGDLQAWQSLMRQHQAIVFRTAYLVVRDSTIAEETTKRTFSRAYRTLASNSGDIAVRPWLMGITTSIARMQLRDLGQQRDARMLEHEPCPRLPARPTLLDRGNPVPTPDEREAILDAFDAMLDEDRLIIASRYAFLISRVEAEARLGVGPDEVERRLGASMGRLRANLRRLVATSAWAGQGHAREIGRGSPVDRMVTLSDDALGNVAMAVVMSDLPWTPDVAPFVCQRLAREAHAYPTHLGVTA
jgi:RNA polymerase sigma-70 factor, ECF subfamily